jgi:hypothetical protein
MAQGGQRLPPHIFNILRDIPFQINLQPTTLGRRQSAATSGNRTIAVKWRAMPDEDEHYVYAIAL